ncbi:MAG: hypothetical protein ACJ71W_17430 [Terriglobales bacterium]
MKKSVNRSTPAVSQTKGHARKQHPAEIALDEAHSAALGLTRAFGCQSQGEAPAIDVVIMGRLSEVLNSLDDALQTACFQRGLLPRIIGNSLRMACFLSQVLPMARAAQADTGVPASILIAEAYEISGAYFYGCAFELHRPEAHDVFNSGESFASIHDAFLSRARSLSEEPAFQSIMRATGDSRIGLTSPAYASNFLALIAAWSRNKYGAELVNTIVSHDLLECDRMRPVV